MYGSTLCVAQAVAAGLADAGHATDVLEVGVAVGDPAWHAAVQLDRDLVVVGAPTHRRGLSTARTRKLARNDGEPVSAGPGIREWLSAGGPPRGALVAVFGTAVGRLGAGSAAEVLARQFRGRLLGAPTSFVVAGRTGGLVEGELDRAWLWGQELAAALALHTSR
jgi:hypothetical protein